MLAILWSFCFISSKIESIKPQPHIQLENDSNFPPGGLYLLIFSLWILNLKFWSTLKVEPLQPREDFNNIEVMKFL